MYCIILCFCQTGVLLWQVPCESSAGGVPGGRYYTGPGQGRGGAAAQHSLWPELSGAGGYVSAEK